jgi:hypothetical protein
MFLSVTRSFMSRSDLRTSQQHISKCVNAIRIVAGGIENWRRWGISCLWDTERTEENKIWRIKTNEELDKFIKQGYIANHIKALRLSWFGQVQRTPDNRTVKMMFKWNPLTKRSQGRPKYRIFDKWRLKTGSSASRIEGNGNRSLRWPKLSAVNPLTPNYV